MGHSHLLLPVLVVLILSVSVALSADAAEASKYPLGG